ncbi:uncharacterized protein CIMG_11356 [Coccidioides immitis RS]|uniref:Uncharacterized protein n=1 Tax=Coccidioides immitis (strain RS) TaxID=246410 RepID=A0A0D8JXK3_COCIM|nr:uncharacterized protein CIMG_11356 [Coccidioides immitis RS]KJF61003.1 hypothetical protein CIMG_11356 [Coccidioides immitis RS]TPX21267.1 hypothetical protein DIZ76_015223 [Coccidioides immitis]
MGELYERLFRSHVANDIWIGLSHPPVGGDSRVPLSIQPTLSGGPKSLIDAVTWPLHNKMPIARAASTHRSLASEHRCLVKLGSTPEFATLYRSIFQISHTRRFSEMTRTVFTHPVRTLRRQGLGSHRNTGTVKNCIDLYVASKIASFASTPVSTDQSGYNKDGVGAQAS